MSEFSTSSSDRHAWWCASTAHLCSPREARKPGTGTLHLTAPIRFDCRFPRLRVMDGKLTRAPFPGHLLRYLRSRVMHMRWIRETWCPYDVRASVSSLQTLASGRGALHDDSPTLQTKYTIHRPCVESIRPRCLICSQSGASFFEATRVLGSSCADICAFVSHTSRSVNISFRLELVHFVAYRHER
jgi:hypothetical protein